MLSNALLSQLSHSDMKSRDKKINIVMLKSVHKKLGIIQHTTKTITIILDDNLVKKVHDIQAKLIKESSKPVSFSRIMNDTLRKSL